MRCKICKKDAIIYLPSHNLALCEDHFFEFCKKRVKKAIDKYGLFKKEDKILVALSGGKDSLTLAYILKELDYEIEGYYIDLGIGTYSENSYLKVKDFSEKFGIKIHIERVGDFFWGLSIPEIAYITRRPSCSVCGHIKRYLMNRFGYENGFTVLATGHNLDDEVGVLFGNLINWKMGYLKRQSPLLPPSDKRLIKKVKPLVLCAERDIAAFALTYGVDYIEMECPHVKGSTYLYNKGLMNKLEEKSPGSKLRFYQGFLQNQNLFKDSEEVKLKECEVCGYPTTSKVCTFCNIRSKVKEKIES